MIVQRLSPTPFVFLWTAPSSSASVLLVEPRKETPRTNSKDYSGIGILLSNLLVIAYALIDDWDLFLMMEIYWAQSILIGIFHFIRILLLRSFSTDGFTSNGKRIPETAAGKRSTAFFFAAHFGLFHLVYAVFLFLPRGPLFVEGGIWLLVSVLGFLAGHAYSFYQNVRDDLGGRPNLGMMMALPYARILPMHLTILFGSQMQSSTGSLLLFSGLKTLADYLMHIVEHRLLQQRKSKQEEKKALAPAKRRR